MPGSATPDFAPPLGKRAEWAEAWPLPFIGMLGIAGPAAFVYSSGVFMEAMTREFGWTRAQFSSAFTLQMLLGLVIGPLGGHLVDRFGPRRMLLVGIVPFAFALSLFGLVNGAYWQWLLLAAIYAPFTLGVSAVPWVTGTMMSFNASRGLAISIVLAGIGLATAVWPVVAAYLTQAVGWRVAYPTMAAAWLVIVLPLTIAFFRPRRDPVDAQAQASRPPLGDVFRSRPFWCLLGAGGLFASVQLALILHLVPIVRAHGFDLATAAGLAALTGVFSIVGRIGTGFLLDWVPTRLIALFAFSLPLVVMALLATPDASLAMLTMAAVLLGFAAGSETDVVTYLATRKFDRRIFGTVYGIIQTGFAICASVGPLLAGWMFDLNANYIGYYIVAVPIVLIATLLIMLVPHAPKVAAAPV